MKTISYATAILTKNIRFNITNQIIKTCFEKTHNPDNNDIIIGINKNHHNNHFEPVFHESGFNLNFEEVNVSFPFNNHLELMLWLIDGNKIMTSHSHDYYELNENGFLFNHTRNITDSSIYFSSYKNYVPILCV